MAWRKLLKNRKRMVDIVQSSVFLCNYQLCRNYANINFYMTASVHQADRRDDIVLYIE